MGRPYLTHEQVVSRLKAFGKGYTFRTGEYNGTRLHYDIVCPKHPQNIWPVLGSNLLANSTCPLCSNEKQSRDRVMSHEEVVDLFNKDGRGYKLREGQLYTGNKNNLYVVCPDHPEYEWFTRPLDVIYDQKKCPVCIGQAKLSNEIIDERLKDKSIVRLSDYLGSTKSDMRFKCLKDGYEWDSRVSRVVNGEAGCPKCANSLPWTDERLDSYLQDNQPTIERISSVITANAQTKFKCLVDGYEWSTEIGNIRNGYGCPCCATTKHWNTELASRWLVEHRPHISVIGELNGSSKYSLFKCSIHNIEFKKKLGYFRKGYDCPECANSGGFKTNLKAYLYYAKVVVHNTDYFKIGITNRTPETRVKETRHNFEIIKAYEFDVGKVADNLESQLLYKFKHLIQTEHKFSGSTECFIEDIRKYVDLDKFVCDNTQNNQGL